MELENRVCTKCGHKKPTNAFYPNRGDCKVCCSQRRSEFYEANKPRIAKQMSDWYRKNIEAQRAYGRKASKRYTREKLTRAARLRNNLKKKYGLSVDRFREMEANQRGLCAICGESPKLHGRLSVDHDHSSGKTRGLLCLQCNTALGSLRDSPGRLRAAIIYLEAYGIK